MFVGREKELHLLHDIQNDDSSHFGAVYEMCIRDRL